jgi:protein SCO1/2
MARLAQLRVARPSVELPIRRLMVPPWFSYLDAFNTSDTGWLRSCYRRAAGRRAAQPQGTELPGTTGAEPCHTLAAMPVPPADRAFGARLLACGAALALLACTAGCGSARSGSSTPSAGAPVPGSGGFDGAALPAGISAPQVALRDQSGARVSLAGYRGRVVVLTSLYSTCGSPCSVIAQQIRGALDELHAPVPVLAISADPSADTPARVRRFLQANALDGRVRWVVGSRAALGALRRRLRLPDASAGARAFARTAPVYLIDRNGMERVIFQLEQLTPEALSHDLRKLLER